MKRFAFVLALAALAGCADQPTAPAATRPAGRVARGAVLPVSRVSVSCPSLTVGAVGLCMAYGYDSAGHMVSTSAFWYSNNPAVVTVSSGGVVTGRMAGTAVVSAQIGGVTGSAPVVVRAAPYMASVRVSPAPATVYVAGTLQLAAAPYDQYGNKISGTFTTTWSSANTAAATVSSTGLVTGVAAGSSTVSATISGLTGSSAVTVSTGSTGGGGIGGGGCGMGPTSCP